MDVEAALVLGVRCLTVARARERGFQLAVLVTFPSVMCDRKD